MQDEMDWSHPKPDPDALESGDDGSFAQKKRAKRRVPRKMSAQRLHRIALNYLDRYEASEATFRAMLTRRVFKSAHAHAQDPGEFTRMIDDEVAKMVKAGFINNERFAQNQVFQQRGRGASTRAIQARLKAKGVEEGYIDQALESDARDDASAARRYARRRRLGPYRTKDRAEKRDRDVAALCRSGFGYGLAASIIDGDVDDETQARDG